MKAKHEPMTDAAERDIRTRLANLERAAEIPVHLEFGEREYMRDVGTLLATIDALRVLANEIGAEQLRSGAETMRAACAYLLRRVAQEDAKHGSVGATLARIANDYADAIASLPLPEGEPVVMSPTKGAVGRLLYKDDRVMVCRVTLEPGAEWPKETHPDQSETILRTRGNLRLMLNDLHPMCRSNVEPGEAHRVRNASDTERAEYISVLRRPPEESRRSR